MQANRSLRRTVLWLGLGVLSGAGLNADAADPSATPPSAAQPAEGAQPTASTQPAAAVPSDAPPAVTKPRSGERIELQQDGKPFSAIYTEDTTGKPRGAVLILPDVNASADAPGVVSTLRTALPRSGWSSLALELPFVAPASARSAYGTELEAATKRVQAAFEFLQSKQVTQVVLLGHGLGATVGALLLSRGGPDSVLGLAAVGWDAGNDLVPPVDLPAALEKLKVPVLDLYGGRDFGPVRALADRRRSAVRKAQPDAYTRVEVRDATHEFTGLELFLVNRVRGWMERVRAQRSTPSASKPTPAGVMMP